MNNINNDLITVEQASTLDGLFYERTTRSTDQIAYIQYNKSHKAWEETSWNKMAIIVGQWQKAIIGEHTIR